MDGRWPQRVEYCPGMRARHGVGHGVESQTWPFRSAPCLPIQQVRHRAIVRSATAAALRPRAQHEKACGYVDNARALPTSSQATAKTAKPCLIAYEPGRGQIRIRHPPRRLDGAQPLSYQAITPTMRRCWQPFTPLPAKVASAVQPIKLAMNARPSITTTLITAAPPANLSDVLSTAEWSVWSDKNLLLTILQPRLWGARS